MEDIAKLLEADSEWLSAADLCGKKKVIEITGFETFKEKNGKGKMVEKPIFHLKGTTKKYKPPVTQARVICNPEYCGWGTKPSVFMCRFLEVYPAKVYWKGELVWGVRLCGASHIKSDFIAEVVEGMKKYSYPIRKIAVESDKKPSPEKPAPKVADNSKNEIITALKAVTKQEQLDEAAAKYRASIASYKKTDLDVFNELCQAVQDAKDRIDTPHDSETGEVIEDMPPTPPVEAYEDSIGGEPVNEEVEQDLF